MYQRKNAIIVNLLALIVVFLGMIFFIELQTERSHETNELKYRTDEVSRLFPYMQEVLTGELELSLTSLLNVPGLIEAFETGERQRLLELTAPFYYEQRDGMIDVLSFVKADNRHFLRVHDPEHFGDDVSTVRPVIRNVNRDKKVHSGFEATLYGEYLLVFVPVFEKERYVGFVQAGMALEKVRAKLEELLNAPAAILIDAAVLEKEVEPEPKAVVGDLLVATAPEFFVPSDAIAEAENGSLYSFGEHRYSLVVREIESDVGANWGRIVLFYDVSFFEEHRVERLTQHLVIILAALVLSGLIMRFYYRSFNRALIRSEKLFKSIAGSMGEGLYVLDADGNVVFINTVGADTLGFTPEELRGKNIHDLIHHHNPGGEAVASGACPILEVIRTGRPFCESGDIFFTKSGEEIPVRHATTPLFEKKKLSGSITVFQDITEFKRNEERLRTLNATLEERVEEKTEELQSSNRVLEKHILELELLNAQLSEAKERALQAAQARSNFISSVSHELRTPLNAIINFTDQVVEDFEEMVRDPELQRESRGYLQRVLVNSRHLLQLINELLEFTKAEAGKIDYNIKVQDINGVVGAAYSNTHSLLSGSPVDFRLQLADKPLMAAVDSRRLLQVLLNLLSNAVKFTEKGFVELRSFDEAGRIVIEIEDTGRGIPAEKREAIFDPFAQVDGNDPGTGLGLGLVKHMCDDMQIAISVTSVIGKGSIFRLETGHR